ncbi:MAG: extracellular solute-binding protein [Azospirillum sp.]|nr:extracellular solute-binding protein [Azospirillum sp.]
MALARFLAMVLLAVAVSTGLPAAAIAETAGEVNVYSARHYDVDRALYSNFTAETGIRVNLIEGKEDELIERIRNEGNNSPADLLITVDAGRLYRAQDAGLLQPIRSEVLEREIPPHLREPEGYWFGLSKRARVLIYDKAAVKPSELSTYEDLADPKWRGRLLVRSSTSVYNQSLVGSLLAADGEPATEAWAKAVVANLARPPQGGDIDQIKAVAAGEGDVAISNTYYFGRLINSPRAQVKELAQRLGVFFPNQDGRGTHVNISGAGVIKTAAHRAEAIRFLEYLVTPEAQRLFADGNFEYPVVAAVPPHPSVAAWGTFKEDPLNAAVYGRSNAEALKIMDRAGWK